MPKIKGAVNERMSKTTTNIDLSTSENWLLRPELVEICQDAIAQTLSPKVRIWVYILYISNNRPQLRISAQILHPARLILANKVFVALLLPQRLLRRS